MVGVAGTPDTLWYVSPVHRIHGGLVPLLYRSNGKFMGTSLWCTGARLMDLDSRRFLIHISIYVSDVFMYWILGKTYRFRCPESAAVGFG